MAGVSGFRRVFSRSVAWETGRTAVYTTVYGSRLFAAEAAPETPSVAGEDAAPPQQPRKKYFSRFKRAGRLMTELNREHKERRDAMLHNFRPDMPAFDVGDALEVTYAGEMADKKPAKVRGVVIAKRKKGLDSNFTIINEEGEDTYMATYVYSSPLLRSIRLMRKRHVTGGARRPRRAKLYDLWRGPPSKYKVTKDTKEQWEVQLEAKIKKALQARGRDASKRAIAEEKEKILSTGKGLFRVDATFDE